MFALVTFIKPFSKVYNYLSGGEIFITFGKSKKKSNMSDWNLNYFNKIKLKNKRSNCGDDKF
jgi:hypothetical protein